MFDIKPLERYDTEDDYTMLYVHSSDAMKLEEVNEFMEAALKIGLLTVVIPKRIQIGGWAPKNRYVLHFYRFEKIEEGEL